MSPHREIPMLGEWLARFQRQIEPGFAEFSLLWRDLRPVDLNFLAALGSHPNHSIRAHDDFSRNRFAVLQMDHVGFLFRFRIVQWRPRGGHNFFPFANIAINFSSPFADGAFDFGRAFASWASAQIHRDATLNLNQLADVRLAP